jgi:hypothetical protein
MAMLKTSSLVKVLVLVLRCSKKAGHACTSWTQLLLDVERMNSIVLPTSLEKVVISFTISFTLRSITPVFTRQYHLSLSFAQNCAPPSHHSILQGPSHHQSPNLPRSRTFPSLSLHLYCPHPFTLQGLTAYRTPARLWLIGIQRKLRIPLLPAP